MDFLLAREKSLLYSGAFGAGKTRALCLRAAMRASIRGSSEGLCRKYLVSLKSTTLRTLLEPDGDLPAVLPPGSYEHNKSEKIIRLNGGGEIVYFGLDDHKKIGSFNFTGVQVDECVEITEADWIQLRGRLRRNILGLPRQISGACNPGSPSHWLCKYFGVAGGHKCLPNHRAIMTCSSDNWFLPKDYIDDLNTFTGLAKARYVEGRWVGSEGLVYDRWDRLLFVKVREEPVWKRVVVGVDEGYTNPAVLLVICEDHDGRIHVPCEWYKRKQLEPQVLEQAELWAAEYHPELFVADPSAAKLRAAMTARGLPVKPANNDVFGGIQTLQKYLVIAGDGLPRITVDPRCENVIREFETYEWKLRDKANSTDTKDEPIKVNDHAMDALRYGVNEISPFSMVVVPSSRIAGGNELSSGFSAMNVSSDNDEDLD